jgi:hypothetical protein
VGPEIAKTGAVELSLKCPSRSVGGKVEALFGIISFYLLDRFP